MPRNCSNAPKILKPKTNVIKEIDQVAHNRPGPPTRLNNNAGVSLDADSHASNPQRVAHASNRHKTPNGDLRAHEALANQRSNHVTNLRRDRTARGMSPRTTRSALNPPTFSLHSKDTWNGEACVPLGPETEHLGGVPSYAAASVLDAAALLCPRLSFPAPGNTCPSIQDPKDPAI